MKFHLFSLIITIQKKSLSEAELKQEQQYKKIMDEIRGRRTKYYSHL
ncbi:YrzI family protein [Bacillus thuringiensis serovar pingluonsis]|uniref:YrzI family protein n=2 Tax=Bacillus thuringiensis TaxID=1428 RepID=A0A243CXF5_BACTU|nr:MULTISPECIES: YrzI family small protein [Bacillus cereus group]MCU5690629.1 YrzI family small protein [Bacillus cereus]MEB9685456.1 YrzI family small protein [Bacillus anthracis]MEB9907072.1 YrzI family small protein [Bacillus anthracis]MEC1955049.1 YrzI family small protein [Bacillus anthracis]OTY50233.1 YrzI family protein [Bacillus thuringiensis serovar pingluonsis]